MPIIEKCDVHRETWPLANPFRISRGAKSVARVVTVTLTLNGYSGRGECCPYPRYGESVAHTVTTLRDFDWAPFAALNLTEMRHALCQHLPAGRARNALDCARLALAAKTTGRPVCRTAIRRLGLEPMSPTCCCTRA